MERPRAGPHSLVVVIVMGNWWAKPSEHAAAAERTIHDPLAVRLTLRPHPEEEHMREPVTIVVLVRAAPGGVKQTCAAATAGTTLLHCSLMEPESMPPFTAGEWMQVIRAMVQAVAKYMQSDDILNEVVVVEIRDPPHAQLRTTLPAELQTLRWDGRVPDAVQVQGGVQFMYPFREPNGG